MPLPPSLFSIPSLPRTLNPTRSFPLNPAPNWGPLARAKRRHEGDDITAEGDDVTATGDGIPDDDDKDEKDTRP